MKQLALLAYLSAQRELHAKDKKQQNEQANGVKGIIIKNIRYFLLSLNMLVMDESALALKKSRRDSELIFMKQLYILNIIMII